MIRYQPQETQKKYWELLRYPGLAEKLVVDGPKSREEIRCILKDYPDEIHPIAMEYGVSRFRTLEKISAINGQAEAVLELLMENYDADVQENVKLLLQFPEVLHILIDQIDLAILVGEHYKNNPELVIAKADSIRTAVARRNAKDLDDWKKGLEEDPRSLAEFE